jgi:radical SAM superfamily enzyme YgiQ (UPF0313 family)
MRYAVLERSMHVVLVNPGSPLRRTGGLLARFVEPIPPLGLTGLAAFLRPHGHSVAVLDQYATAEDADTLTARILAERPGLVGFSCLTPNMGEVLDVVARLRAQAPTLPIVFGNTHAAVFHDRILSRREADYCVRGEGEEPLLALVDALEGRRTLSSVPNLGYRAEDGTVVRTPDAKPEVPLDDLPFPDWSRIDLGAYVNHPMIAMHGATLPIQGSRGCAYACTFCAQDQIFKSVRRRSHASICDEIEHNIATYGVTQFGFIDAYWPLSVKQGHAFLDELERRGLHRRITWVTETRVDKVDEPLLRRMAADGCRLIMYGVEFGDDEMLVATQKRTKSSQTRSAGPMRPAS